ncbi:hypothetical protein [Nonomuraea sp. SYSU D8015]|uniref:hypothetical protein n=1 Tax=Nonomuraea sp. SYSU D8015 TaxID=2593644 RepID=UPI001660FC8F|nr:hypothetical protein [Nonomuraea sp. SYSU D8015]
MRIRLPAFFVVASLAAACSAAPPSPPPSPGRSATPTATTTPTGTPSATRAPLRVPAMDEGSKTLLKAGPSNGSMDLGEIPRGKGPLWVLFDCRGSGKAQVILGTEATLNPTCEPDGAFAYKMDLTLSRTLPVQVQVTGELEWALRITR